MHIEATPEEIWALLAEPKEYEHFVVGARTVRDADSSWPAPGAAIHHSSGIWPLVLRDVTTVRESQPPRRLSLEVRLRPLGRLCVVFHLRHAGSGTALEVEEIPTEGVIAWSGWHRLVDIGLAARNLEMLRRIRRRAETRSPRSQWASLARAVLRHGA